MKTLSQEYATDVFEKVNAFGKAHKEGSNACKEYGSMAHKLPVLVRQAGLVQAVVFVETRGKESHKQLLNDLAATLGKVDAKTFREECQKTDLAEYMWLTRKTLAALEWYKRFAESVLNVKPGEKGEEEDGR
jgi:CRISPR-associated protein Cmr5